MKIFNSFGITPTNTHLSAGSDYYIPNIDSPEKLNKAVEAFQKSYNCTTDEINEIMTCLLSKYYGKNEYKKHIGNLTHLFLALYDPHLEEVKKESLYKAIDMFCDDFVIYDKKKDVVGIKVRLNDTLFINSGIKIALDTVAQERNFDAKSLGIGIAGLYVNKSGMGNKGWDVRACLVDEDYSGFVHLSQAYTKNVIEDGHNIVYCGDKLTQMMLIPIFHTNYEEISEDEYNKIMSSSTRGAAGFGSSDVKH